MIPASPEGRDLTEIISRCRYLLLDFDGPICQIYAGLPAPVVADRLRKLLTGQALPLPDEIAATDDPLEVFAYAGNVNAELAVQVEAELTDLEVTAVATARPTGYGHDVVTSCRESGRKVAVVSNNSERAVRSYLTRYSLDEHIAAVAGRTSADPRLLKPNPHLVEQAVMALGAEPSECVFIGDSTTDVDAAELVGAFSIGFAQRPDKQKVLSAAGANAVIASMADLVLILRAHPLNG